MQWLHVSFRPWRPKSASICRSTNGPVFATQQPPAVANLARQKPRGSAQSASSYRSTNWPVFATQQPVVSNLAGQKPRGSGGKGNLDVRHLAPQVTWMCSGSMSAFGPAVANLARQKPRGSAQSASIYRSTNRPVFATQHQPWQIWQGKNHVVLRAKVTWMCAIWPCR